MVASDNFGASGVTVLMRVIARLELAPQKVTEDERLELRGAGARQRRDLCRDMRVEEERHRIAFTSGCVDYPVGVEISRPFDMRCSMSLTLTISAPSIGGTSSQSPDGVCTCNPPTSSCASRVRQPKLRCGADPQR